MWSRAIFVPYTYVYVCTMWRRGDTSCYWIQASYKLGNLFYQNGPKSISRPEVKIHIVVIWVLPLCSLITGYQCFERTWCLQFQVLNNFNPENWVGIFSRNAITHLPTNVEVIYTVNMGQCRPPNRWYPLTNVEVAFTLMMETTCPPEMSVITYQTTQCKHSEDLTDST